MDSAFRLDPVGRRSPVRHVIVGANFAAERCAGSCAARERALAEYPERPDLHVLRAALLAQAGRLEEARLSVAEARRLQPNFPVAAFGNRFAHPVISGRFQTALREAEF